MDIATINKQVQQESIFLQDLKREVGKVIVGQDALLEKMLVALLADGHILIEGVPGLAKTLAVKTLAQAIHAQFQRIQFTPDLLPADITGTLIFNPKDGLFYPKRGPVFSNFVLADEINRSPAKVQSALLEAMQERQVTIGEQTYKLPSPFMVMATQNPVEQEGTYPLPEAQLDRFLFKIDVPFPNKDELHEVLRRTTAGESPKVSAVMSKQDILTLRALAAEVPIAEHVQDYALKIVLGTHPEMDTCSERVKKYVRFGSSPRGAQAIIKAAKIHAIFDGRFNVSNDDIRFAAVPALRHRTILNFEGVAENISTDDILADLIKHTRETAQK